MPNDPSRARRCRPLAALALLLAAPPAWTQSVDEVLARHVEARGGRQRLKQLTSVRMSGTIAFGEGPAAPFVLLMRRPNQMRTEFSFQGQTGIQAFDGERAWAVLPMTGKSEPEYLPAEASREAADQADIEGPLVDAAAKGHRVVLAGRERVEGRECLKLELTLKSGAVRHVYLDAESFLEVKGEGRRRAGSDEVVLETYYRDYREVAGLTLPHRIEAGPAKRPERQKIVIERVEVNVPLRAEDFAPPRPARGQR
jgi:outer membrane lipoprotein-sorting protein